MALTRDHVLLAVLRECAERGLVAHGLRRHRGLVEHHAEMLARALTAGPPEPQIRLLPGPQARHSVDSDTAVMTTLPQVRGRERAEAA